MLVDIQLETIDLQRDANQLKDKFASVGLGTFYQYLLPFYSKLIAQAVKLLCMFGTTYLKQVFSVMNINKNKALLTHTNYILKLAAIQDMMSDIDALAKRCQASGTNKQRVIRILH